jgi:hypothetical protein
LNTTPCASTSMYRTVKGKVKTSLMKEEPLRALARRSA